MITYYSTKPSEWALITGIACILATFLLNWIYRHKEYRFRTKRDQ